MLCRPSNQGTETEPRTTDVSLPLLAGEDDIQVRDKERKSPDRLYAISEVSTIGEDSVKPSKKNVLKILLLDVLFPLADIVTDILQGVFLLTKDDCETYGVLVLLICWVPGLIYILHVWSDYR